jgi:hypothetical protein
MLEVVATEVVGHLGSNRVVKCHQFFKRHPVRSIGNAQRFGSIGRNVDVWIGTNPKIVYPSNLRIFSITVTAEKTALWRDRRVNML